MLKKLRKRLNGTILGRKSPKSYWNHRVLAFVEDEGTDLESIEFRICEVYYTNGIPYGFCDCKSIAGDDSYDLLWTLERMKECINEPILCGNEGKFPEEYKK